MKKFVSLVGAAAIGTAGFIGLASSPVSAATPVQDQVCVVVNTELAKLAPQVIVATTKATATASAEATADAAMNAALGTYATTAAAVVVGSDTNDPAIATLKSALTSAGSIFSNSITTWSNAVVNAQKATTDLDKLVLLDDVYQALDSSLGC